MLMRVGSRVSVRFNGKSISRTIKHIGDNYVVIEICKVEHKIPFHWITSTTEK